MALGVSVASATDPKVQWKNTDGTQTDVSLTGATWGTTNGENSGYKQLQVDETAVENIIMTFVPNDSSNTSSTAPEVTSDGSIATKVNGENSTIQGFLIQQGGQAANGGKPELTLTTGSSTTAGIMLGANGTGNLYLNFLELTPDDTDGNDNSWGDPSKTQIRKMILDLSSATTTQYSLVGNIVVDAGRAHKVYGENAFEATFGKGMKGDLTLRANVLNASYRNDLISKIVFLDGSGIEGNVNISAGQSPSTVASISGTKVPYGGNNFVFRKNSDGNVGGITGTLTITGGYTRFYHEANDVDFSTAMVLRGGTLVFDNYKNIGTALADSSLNNSNITSNTLTLLNLDASTISGGSITFNGYNQIIFGSDGNGTFTIAPETISAPTTDNPDRTVTYSGGTASFIFGSSVTPNSQENPIIKGNINVTKGNVIFALSDTSSVNGSNPFTTPDATQPENIYYVDGSISITDGGISAFWNDEKGFYGKVATTNGNSFSISGGLIGKNDIWFADAQNISSIQATSGVSHLVFDSTATIGALPANGDPLSDAILARSGNAMILFKGQATINGNIKSSPNRNITIIAKQGITFNGSIDALQGDATTYNRFDITGTTTFENSAISAVSDTQYGGGFKKYNLFKLNGKVEGTIADMTSIVSFLEVQNNFSSRANNVLSFESEEAQSLSITTINGQISGGQRTGFNYIGKGFTTGSQDTLALNSEIFNDGSWGNSSHTANITLTNNTIRAIGAPSSPSRGANYINVAGLVNTGGISTTAGASNYIHVYETASIAGVSTKEGGNNYIYTHGTASITGDISIAANTEPVSNTNRFFFSGTSATLGDESNKIKIEIKNATYDGYGWNTDGSNTLVFGAETNTLYLSELMLDGDWGYTNPPISKTFNALSFNNASDQGARNIGSIGSISVKNGSNIIGGNLVTIGGDYNDNLFGSGSTPTIQSGFIGEFVKDHYSANGSFVIGDNSGSDITNAITTSRGGTNYINIKGSTTIKGNILSSNQETNGQGHNNLVVLTGTSATLGESGKEISIKVDNKNVVGWKYSNNTLLFGAETNTLHLSELNISGDTGYSPDPVPRTFNALSFNNASGNNTANIASVSATNGSNIIGKNLITQDSGYNTTFFGNETTPIIQSGFAEEFMKDDYTASGTYTLGNVTARGGSNYINVETLTATTVTVSGGNNYLFLGTGENQIGTITANSGTNNINSKGLEITTLTATGGTNNINSGDLRIAIINGVASEANAIPTISANGGINKITATTLTINSGSIIAGGNTSASNGGDSGAQGKNLIEISGEATLGNNLTLRASNRNNTNTEKNNILKFGGAIANNSASIKELTAINGNTKNILSFDALSSNTTLTITDINKADTIGNYSTGNNYIGKSLTSGTASDGSLTLVSGFNDTTWSSEDYKANNLNLVVTNDISAKGGSNFINVKSIAITNGGLTSNNGGRNFLNAESITLDGNVTVIGNSANTGHNVLITEDLNLASSDVITISASGTWLAKNLFDISGTTTIANNLVIKADNTGNSNTVSYNIFKFGGDVVSGNTKTNEIVVVELTAASVNSNLDRTKNILSFDDLTSTLTLNITDINKSDTIGNYRTGYNYIGKGLTTGSGSSLNFNSSFSDSNWDSASYQASSLTLEVTGDIYAKAGKNYINVGTLNANTITSTSGGANNIAIGTSGVVAGSITIDGSSQNNFTLSADNASLTLQGVENTITTLKAFQTATASNTLILDASSNDNVEATIGTLTNGDKLNVNFAGINGTKSTKLTLNTANATTLKSVTVASGTNNTLALSGNATTTIAETVSVGANEGLTFDLGSGSSVAFGENLTTQATGSTTFILGGTSNTITGTLSNSGSHTFVVGASSATLQYENGLAFSSGENNINFLAGTSTLNWKNSDGTAFADISTSTAGAITNINLVDDSEVTIGSTSQITTAGGTTNINFVGNSSLTVDQISTAGGTTDIRVANGANGILNGVIAKTGGSSVITFLKAPSSRAQNTNTPSSLTLNGATNALTNVVAEGTYGLLASGNSTVNTIDSITLDATGKLAFYNGTSTITTISAGNGTLELTTKADKVNTIVNASGISGGLNILFSGSTNDNYHYSTLSLTGTSNQIASVTSNAKNAVIKLNGTGGDASATIEDKITIGSGNALIFSLVGTHNATATASQGITVEGGGILGISIGGSTGTKSVSVTGGDIDFRDNSTLLIDFLADAGGNVTLGSNNGKITIGDNRNSIINFRGSGKATVNGGIVIDGGNNTVNFLGNGATLSGIELKSGNNTINVASDGSGTGITGTIVTSSVGSVTNTINLDDNATLSLKASEGGNAGEGSLISESLNNTLNFKGDGSKLEGSFGAKSATEGKAFINVGSTDKTQVSGTITGVVSYANLAFNAGDSKLTLQGKTNTLKDITSQATKGTLVLDTATNSDEVNVEVSGNGTIGADKELNIEFGGNSASKFEVKGKMSVAGTLGITVNGNGAKTVAGNIDLGGRGTLIVDLASGSGTVSLGDGTQSISIRNGETSIINFADASTASLSNGISLDGGRNELNFARSATVGNIKLNQGTNIIDIAGKDGTGNTVELTNIGSVGSVANTINLGKNAEIKIGSSGDGGFTTSLSNTLNFNGESAKFSGGFGASGSGIASINVNATDASITGDVANSSLIFGADATTITLEGANNTLTTISTPTSKNIQSARMARVVTGNTLTLSTTASRANSTMVSGVINAKDLTVELGGTDAAHNATLTLSGGTLGAIKVTKGDASANTLGFRSGTTTIIGAIDNTAIGNTLGLTLNLNGGNLILDKAIDTTLSNGTGTVNVIANNATLQLKGETNKINSLSGNGVIDLAVADFDGNTVTRSVRAREFKTLEITDYSGNNTFNLYVKPNQTQQQQAAQADSIAITGQSATGSATFTVMGNIDDILGITYEEGGSNNVQVASGTTGISVVGGDSFVGYDIIQAQVIQTDDGNVYLGEAISKGVAQEVKDVASSALTVNYDLFLANFNSLNKRMGELRDNPYSQGVWARVYGGAMSNDFGAGSKTEYVTTQGGYDYSLTFDNARNYMGVAIAYGHSTTKSNTLNIQASQGASIALQDVNSNMVEVGIYNSYVMDNGWYNDTILKFDYIMSTFTMTDNTALESETNNFAMVLSNEFGYRYKFAENEKGNWYIDPQVEVAFGYFNQSDFNRAMVATNSTLQATQDTILTLRSRVGATLGKKFKSERGFASLYVGAFYEYDYIEGGNANASSFGVINSIDSIESNGRAIVNIGSNIELSDGVRMYIDVEKSFGDKQRTDMQFNFGARYSFGEKTPTLSYQEQQKQNVAPLKIEEKKEN